MSSNRLSGYEAPFGLIAIALVVACIIGFTFFLAKMESDTYNRLTGAKTTWWDALWVELRVMEAPRVEGKQ